MAERTAPPLEAADVLTWLRKRGVVVHHAAVLPVVPDRRTVVVFLEGHLGGWEYAQVQALKMRAVDRVEFSGATMAIMYVIGK